MQAKEVTVRLQALDGVWEVGGRDRKRGIWPENVSLTSDLWGSLTASFDLRRDGRAIWPDLGAYTPVEIEIGGTVVWAGRIQQTPTTLTAADKVISVQCQGWQAHLDDDLYEKTYVHTRLSEWRDARTFPTTTINRVGMAAATVGSDQGAITLGWGKGSQIGTGFPYAGVVLDLGPSSTAKRIVLTLDCPGRTATGGVFGFAIVGGDTEDVLVAGSDVPVNVDVTTLATGGTITTLSGTFSSPHRYVGIDVYFEGGSPVTLAEDNLVRLQSVQVFADTAYESGNASILKASTVIADAIARATVLLSPDLSGLGATTFSIPSFALDAPQTPREVWSAVNAYHDWISQIDVAKRPVFKAKPTAPMFEVGAWSPLELEDQSANSGDEIYNRVIVQGAEPDGSPLRVARIGSGSHAVYPFPDAGPWSGAASTPGPSVLPKPAFRWKVGFTYTLSALVMRSATTVTGMTLVFRIGNTTATSPVLTPAAGVWAPVTLTITPSAEDVFLANIGQASLTVNATGTGTTSFDAISVLAPGSSLPDRRGFTRTKALPVTNAITVAAAQQIGDLWLTAHKTTPYKGTFKLTGDKSVRSPATGTPVKLETLLLHTGELIRDMAAIDPDTGGIGRDGRIAQVTYTPASEEATVTLDNSRASFEALLARFDLVSSNGK